MIIENFKEQAELMYETVREIFSDRLERLDQYLAVYQEAGDLQGLDEEELEEILPVMVHQQALTKKLVDKINDVNTRTWFVELVGSQLQEKVSSEDLDILGKAIEIQNRIDDVFEQGSTELVSYLGKDVVNEVVIN